MIKMDIKFTDNFSRDAAKMIKELEKVPLEAHKEFVKLTPIDKGNARRNTSLQGNTINANYQYARRLDEGWSKQAPKGMVDPITEWLDKKFKSIFGR